MITQAMVAAGFGKKEQTAKAKPEEAKPLPNSGSNLDQREFWNAPGNTAKEEITPRDMWPAGTGLNQPVPTLPTDFKDPMNVGLPAGNTPTSTSTGKPSNSSAFTSSTPRPLLGSDAQYKPPGADRLGKPAITPTSGTTARPAPKPSSSPKRGS